MGLEQQPVSQILQLFIMIKEEHMKEGTQPPGEPFAHVEFMEKTFANLRSFCDAEYRRLATGEKEPPQPQPEKNKHPLYLV
ncbi:hypothetical protein HB435_002657 [Salmonella enterica subsp. enterica serovar Stanley]|nr:hypothetical protein [Salmonella enterica subsp. enterica serovar Stanley]